MAVLLHLGDVAERGGGAHVVKAREARVARRVGDGIAVKVGDRTGGADDRVGELCPEQGLEALVAARLVG